MDTSVLVPPYQLQQHLAAVDAARMRGKHQEEIEFLGGEFDRFSVQGDPASVGINEQIPQVEGLR